ncbi:phytanoyl-CoA dioxygenase family protein [Sphingomonas sp. A2-49]|uniref:phytanoyl-CoA dioxygenase family protein n=1 Tax=Sphingomonas sp. A2-49 TaxID=1391375 RepID=UPI0021CFE622|nr:phytanoyl-CoA dioxygenase family protein [Sphingomonas sp. A2-49]MCU6452692.1 phytanoyl-CoA dioxygenase family protein [Sphingomonas sp. A2-49]
MKAALAEAGFVRWPGVLDAEACDDLRALFDSHANDRPGVRIDPADCATLAAYRAVAPTLRALLGPRARPVRALLFEKRDGINWALGWHQDRTIEVVERVDVPDYGPWTVKQGRIHVAPPIGLLAAMLTVRLHLDPVPCDNAPLLVAPGSHRLGLVAENAIDAVVARCGTATCLAEAGQAWIYATPILHASARSTSGGRRRVLQFDVAACDLPGGLRWAADARERALEGRPASA